MRATRMRVANLALSNLSNIGTNLCRGLLALGHEARSVVLEPAPYGMDTDLLWSRDRAETDAFLAAADVFHLNSFLVGGTLMLNRPPAKLARLTRRRRVVLQYHGGDLRRAMHPSVKALIARHRFPVLVTVPDLAAHLPGATWLPIPVDPADPRYVPAMPPPSPIRICHAPTTRGVKKTDAFLAAVERLRKRGMGVEAVLIENRPYAECLSIKGTCHINFDNIGYGSYALASIESMLMGQPSLVYLNDLCRQAVKAHSSEVGIECPLVEVGDPRQPTDEALRDVLEGRAAPTYTEEDVASIERALEPLVTDAGLRAELGKRGQAWAAAVHDERRVARMAAAAYESAPTFDGLGLRERAAQFLWWSTKSARNVIGRGAS